MAGNSNASMMLRNDRKSFSGVQNTLKSLIKGETKKLNSLLVIPLKMQINNNPAEVIEGSNGYWLASSTVSSHLGVMCYLFKKIHSIRVHYFFSQFYYSFFVN